MKALRFSMHSASAVVELAPGGILIVKTGGVLTGGAMNHFKRCIVEADIQGLRGFVVDYRGAVVAMGPGGLDAVLDGDAEDSAPALPAAMIVRPECADLFRGHALRVAGAMGIMRRVFTGPNLAPALAWATEQAAARRP